MHSFGSGYTHAYGSEGYHHYMRQYDPSYDAFFTDGPSVEDKWRNTYPYVPTSYQASSDGQLEHVAYTRCKSGSEMHSLDKSKKVIIKVEKLPKHRPRYKYFTHACNLLPHIRRFHSSVATSTALEKNARSQHKLCHLPIDFSHVLLAFSKLPALTVNCNLNSPSMKKQRSRFYICSTAPYS